MTTFNWESVSVEEIERIISENSTATKKRLAAFERMNGSCSNIRKTAITIPEGAEVSFPVFEAHAGITILEIFQKPFSKLALTYIQNGAATADSMMLIRIYLDSEASCETFSAMFGSASSSLFIETFLDGARSSLHERTVYFSSGEQIFDMFSATIMKGENTRARIESRGILADSSQARFDGNIHINSTAKQSSAQLQEHTLLLSPHAKMNAIPGLKIDTNDVMATHSASMTRVDDEQLFYCKSRGIEEREAVRMIAEGFLKGVYSDVTCKKRVDTLIKEKLCKL